LFTASSFNPLVIKGYSMLRSLHWGGLLSAALLVSDVTLASAQSQSDIANKIGASLPDNGRGQITASGVRGVLNAINGARGVPTGIATLDSNGVLPVGQFPPANLLTPTASGRKAVEQGDASGLTLGIGGPNISSALAAIAAASQALTPAAFGTLYGDGQQQVCGAFIATGSTNLTVSGSNCAFTPADVGKLIRVQGAGVTENFGTLSSIPVTGSGSRYQTMPGITLANVGDGAAAARPQMSANSASVASGGSGCLAGGSGNLLFTPTPWLPSSGLGRNVVVSVPITNGVATGTPTIIDAGLYIPSTGASPWNGLPGAAANPVVAVGAVGTASVAGGSLQGIALSNITTAAYTVAPTTPDGAKPKSAWMYLTANGQQPYGYVGTLDGNGKLTGITTVAGYSPAQGINGPVGVVIPAPAAQQCATAPTLNFDWRLTGVTIQDSGAQIPLSGATASVSGGSPSTAATVGTPVVAPITEYLAASITGVSGNTVSLSSQASTTVNGSALVNWFHDDLPAIQACSDSLKPCSLGNGTYWLSKHYEPKSYSRLNGQDTKKTKLILAAGSNDDVVATAQCHTRFGSNTTSIDTNITLNDLYLDGNKPGQVQWAPYLQNIICHYGEQMNWNNITFGSAMGSAMATDSFQYGGGGGGGTNLVSDPGNTGYGRTGWVNNGPHDQRFSTVSFIDACQEGDDQWFGFSTGGAGSGSVTNGHPWHNGFITNRCRHMLRDTTGSFAFPESEFEGGRNEVFSVVGGTIIGPNAKLYAHFGSPGSALEIVGGTGALHNSTLYGGNNGRPIYGTQYGDFFGNVATGSSAAGSNYQQFSQLGPFNFVNSGGGNILQGVGTACCAPYGATSVPTYDPSKDSFNYVQTGGINFAMLPSKATLDNQYTDVTASGTSAFDAGALSYGVNRVAGGTGGVLVPSSYRGASVTVANVSGATIAIYLSGSNYFDYTFGNQYRTIPNGSVMTLRGVAGGGWSATTQTAN
jgi:hypothetical protein